MLARAGFGSRRSCEKLITDGRIAVDGRVVTELGTRVDLTRQKVVCDGTRIRPPPLVHYLVYKPRGWLCAVSDPKESARLVTELVPEERARVFPVGRLDMESEGLLVLTNDGRLANLLTHPRYEVEREYDVAVRGTVSPDALQKLRSGIWLAEGRTAPCEVSFLRRREREDETDLRFVLREGKNRQVRRMLAKVGCHVRRLVRTRLAGIGIGPLKPGQHRILAREEVDALLARSGGGAGGGDDAAPARARGRAGRRRARRGGGFEP